jgi:hypothetical protein
MDFVALVEQKFREVAAVLAGDAGDERLFHDAFSLNTRSVASGSAQVMLYF